MPTKTRSTTEITAQEPTSNGAAAAIAFAEPCIATVGVEGTASFLFHRWLVEAVEEKASAAKGSRAKKTDDLESYVYRDADGRLSIPGEYFRQSVLNAAKFRQDPRSPRKSAMDLWCGWIGAGVLVPGRACLGGACHGAARTLQ